MVAGSSALASELRSYRMHLTELYRNLDSTWLTLDRLRTVYVYPVGLRDVRPAAAVTAIRRLAHRDEHPELLGVRAFAVLLLSVATYTALRASASLL